MKLIDYINSITETERERLATKCGTSLGYLRQVAYGNRRCRESLAINIERESNRMVVCEELRPDVDWFFLRQSNVKVVMQQV